MKSTKPSAGLPRRPRSSKSAWESIAEMLQSWRLRIAANHRENKKRRLRAKRIAVAPPAERLLDGLRQTFQFRGLQRQLQQRRQRRQRKELEAAESQPKRAPMAWLSPRAVELLSVNDASMLLMRSSCSALLLISLISLALSSLPVKLTSPNWYMEILGSFGDSVPVLVLCAVLSLLSLALASDLKRSQVYRGKLLRISRLGYILALMLLPLHLGIMTWLIGSTYNATRIQLNAVEGSSNSLIDAAKPISSTEQFVAFLRSRNLNSNLESISQAPLEQVKSEFIRSVEFQQQQQLQSINASSFALQLRFIVNGVKLFVTLVIFAFFQRIFWILTKRSSYQNVQSDLPTDVSEDTSSSPISK